MTVFQTDRLHSKAFDHAYTRIRRDVKFYQRRQIGLKSLFSIRIDEDVYSNGLLNRAIFDFTGMKKQV